MTQRLLVRRLGMRLACAGFTLVELLVVVAIIGVLLAILLPAVQAAREMARRATCTNHLKQLGLAILNYENQQGTLPAGAHLHDQDHQQSISWRVMILPMLELGTLYEEIEPLPNGGAANFAAEKESIEVYLCPSAAPPTPGARQESHYAGVGGAARGDQYIDLEDARCGDIFTNGLFFPGRATRMEGIIDGTSHTLAIGERVYVFHHWMFGATRVGTPPTEICCGATQNVVFPINADREANGYYVGDFRAPPEAKKTMLLNDLYFGSDHWGGAQFAYADGSVHFLSEAMDFTVYQDVATRDGGEVSRQAP